VIFLLALFCCCFLTEPFFSHRFRVAQSSFRFFTWFFTPDAPTATVFSCPWASIAAAQRFCTGAEDSRVSTGSHQQDASFAQVCARVPNSFIFSAFVFASADLSSDVFRPCVRRRSWFLVKGRLCSSISFLLLSASCRSHFSIWWTVAGRKLVYS
jgi:hypothetical protein